MDKIIRYTHAGHRFEIEGLIEAGYTINVTVIPVEGYEFIQWLTGGSNITELESDEDGNRRFSIYIEECGISFAALFHPVENPEECNKDSIYREILNILYSAGYEGELPWDSSEDIDCDTIYEELEAILSGMIEPNKYIVTLSVNDENMGTVDGDGEYNDGDAVTITATPREHYRFNTWSDENTDSVRTFNINKNITLRADFSPELYEIKVTSNDTTMGGVTGSGEYEYNTEHTITASAEEGYRFVEWNDGNNEQVRTITITGNKEYQAIFEVIEFDKFLVSVNKNIVKYHVSVEKEDYINVNITPGEYDELPTNITAEVVDDYSDQFFAKTIYKFGSSDVDNFDNISSEITITLDGSTNLSKYVDDGTDITTYCETIDDKYKLIEWTVNNNKLTDNPLTVNVTENKVINANIEVWVTFKFELTEIGTVYTLKATENNTVDLVPVESGETKTVEEGEKGLTLNSNTVTFTTEGMEEGYHLEVSYTDKDNITRQITVPGTYCDYDNGIHTNHIIYNIKDGVEYYTVEEKPEHNE